MLASWFRDRYLAVEMSGGIAASYDLHGDYDPGPGGEQIAVDLMTLLGVALAHWGQAELAARMTATFFARSTLAWHAEPAMLLSGAMTEARRISGTLSCCRGNRRQRLQQQVPHEHVLHAHLA